ncbi:lipocalin family protein [Ureibacillus sp. 179-F W5.1 NHS]|uniref:lipocalin family protein n=1 Tax=Ureibacillus sp. 179-F W5.1 NHS TaxID=3374297 RepID=UPI003879CD2D
MKNFSNEVSLPKDTAPHLFSNVEWWYYFAYLTGEKGGRYATMASFFRIGETELNKGHYLIFSLIDLDKEIQYNYSQIDATLKWNLKAFYLPLYLLLRPNDKRIWRLQKSLLKGKIPSPHTQMKKVTIEHNPTELFYGDHQLSFFGEKEDRFNVQLVDKKLEIDLQFAPLKSIALIGEDGKPDELYYYSFTKNEVQGQIRTEQGTQKVTGQGWFDHQWGWDYALLKGNEGWNWFGLQLNDGRELLLNEMHTSGEKTFSPMANLIERDGTLRFSRNVDFQEMKHWQSIQTKGKYPIEWKIVIPDFSMELNVKAAFPNQEMLIIGPLQAIWEGACIVSGQETLASGKRKNIYGKGFMELVGYAN